MEKFKMAAADAEIVTSQLADVIAMKFRRIPSYFIGPAMFWKNVRPNRKWKNPRWRPRRSGIIPFPARSHSEVLSAIELLDPKNTGFAVEIWLIARLHAKLQLLPVRQPPSWIIFHFRFVRTVMFLAPLNCWTPKTSILPSRSG
jgi:hypothetical protein